MPLEITMPRLSDTMEVGTVLQWHVKEGDEVSAGDLLADIETDKATMELQSFDDGTVGNIIVQAGSQVSVGTTIALLIEEDEDASSVPTQEHPVDVGRRQPAKLLGKTHRRRMRGLEEIVVVRQFA